MASLIIIRGGGDLASGTAIRLVRSRFNVVITEIAQPLAIRRTVAFAEAIYEKQVTIEGITGCFVSNWEDTSRIIDVISNKQIPVLVDPQCISADLLQPCVIVDARMTKLPPEPILYHTQLYVGLGPGFTAGKTCHAVVETRRGHTMGRVYWNGSPESDTSLPDGDPRRVLRAPVSGKLVALAEIGQILDKDDLVAEISGHPIRAPFRGVLRGLLHPGLHVEKDWKIADLDSRSDPSYCSLVSDKSLAIGGGVLEAILSVPSLQKQLLE